MKDDRLFYLLVCAVLVVGIVLFTIPARSEQVLQESTVGQGGLICDNAEEVAQFITVAEKTSQQEALMAIDGCGILQRPMRLRVVWVDEIKTDTAVYVVVRYDFLDIQAPPQFGVAHRKLRGASL